jgi:hypothetical protein
MANRSSLGVRARGQPARLVRLPFALCGVVFVVGIALVFTTGGLLGVILIIGAVGAAGWIVVPEIIDMSAHFLSTGTLRRRWREPR